MATITIIGDNNANALTGPSASDKYLIYGLGNNDTLTGNVGDDYLDGGTGMQRTPTGLLATRKSAFNKEYAHA